jgi:hypothetical protein
MLFTKLVKHTKHESCFYSTMGTSKITFAKGYGNFGFLLRRLDGF